MTDIALYNILRKVDGVTDAEAKEAVNDIANSKDMATKADIKGMATKTDLANLETRVIEKMANLETRVIEKMANLETRLVKQIYAVAGIIIVINIASVGLMLRFFMVP